MTLKKYAAGFLILFLALAMAAPCRALSGDEGVEIPMPTGYQIEKSGDLSNAILARLFGTAWGQITGQAGDPIMDAMNSIMGETMGLRLNGSDPPPASLGRFSGLIVSILGVVNVAAMAFVATAIIYMWGIFAVTTAHEGNKLGGSMYNSLWVPVRHACSFSLTVPVLNGLSLMQVAIMACVGLSINFANRVWDASGNYIVNHAHVGIIDSSTPMLESEVRQMIPMMFEGAVQQLLEQGANVDPNNPKENGLLKLADLYALNNSATKSIGVTSMNADTAGAGPFLSSLMKGGQLYVVKDHEKGEAYLSLVPNERVPASAFGGVRFDYPKLAESVAPKGQGKDAPVYYRLKSSLAEIRIRNTADLWGKVYALAGQYLASTSSGGGACAFRGADGQCNPSLDPVKTSAYVQRLIHDYTSNVTAQSAGAVKTVIASERSNLKEAFRKAIDSENGQSKRGWMSAGLFTFTLAALQKRLDDTVMGHTDIIFSERSQNVSRSSQLLPLNAPRFFSTADPVTASWGPEARRALDRMAAFIPQSLMGGESYLAESGAAGDGSKLSEFGARIMKYFLADGNGLGTADRGGMLNTTLALLSTYDPIVVMQTFGNRLLDLAPAFFSGGVLLSLVTDSAIGNGAVIMLMIAGITFAYIVPITPVIFWFKALLSWLYMVVEAMVAAPFWVCAHALPEGTGFAGQHARRGYLMLLDIIIRPCLLVLGAVFAVAIIQASGYMAYILFNEWFVNIAGTFIEIGIMADITFSILLMSIMYYISYTVFTKGVIYLPERVLQWCGGSSGGGLHDEADGTAKILAAGAVFSSAGKSLGTAGNALQGGALGAKNRVKEALAKAADRAGELNCGQISRMEEDTSHSLLDEEDYNRAVSNETGIVTKGGADTFANIAQEDYDRAAGRLQPRNQG